MMQGDREAALVERNRIIAREEKMDQERLDEAASRAAARETSKRDEQARDAAAPIIIGCQ